MRNHEHKTIYIVDDDQDDRFLLREAINEVIKDVKIVEFKDGNELVTLIENNRELNISLLLVDMNMPRMNGLEVTKVLKTNPYFRDLPIIMLSTTSNQELIKSAYLTGIMKFYTKPVTFDALKNLVSIIAQNFI